MSLWMGLQTRRRVGRQLPTRDAGTASIARPRPMAASIVMAGAAADTSDPDHRRLLRGRRVHLRQERGRVLGRVDGGVHGGVLPATYSEAADTHADADN